MKKCVIIYNHQSGNHHVSEKSFYHVLEKYDYTTTIIHTKYKGHASEIIEHLDDADLVISAGGDGTYNEVITGNLNRKKPFLIANLPIGTTNDVGNMYGYTKDTLKNLELVLNGVVKEVDIPKINGHVFTYVASFGNFMNIAYETPRLLKSKYGRLAYIIYGIKIIKDNSLKLYDVTYEIDGVKCSGKYSLIFITSSTRIGGVNDIFEDVKLDDKKFEVVLCNLTSKKDLAKNFLLLPVKHIEEIPGFTVYKAGRFKMNITNTQNTSWCIDGEKLEDEQHSYDLTISDTMKLLVPKVNVDRLFMNKD